MASPHPPPEIIENILLKLPLTSLLRFKSVSKSWNTIISHPLFVRNHHHQNSTFQNLFLRKSSYTPDCGLSLVKLEHGKLQTIKKLKLPYGYDYEYKHAICCFCECGLLLLTNFSFTRFLLWNPSNQTTTELSLPYINGYKAKCCGICYDPSIDDFKVVFLYPDFYAVYSCRTKSWFNIKQHSHDIVSFQPVYNSSGVSINGAIYWLLRDNENKCAEIIYYDSRDDKLKILEKIDDVEGDLLRSYLLDLGGHLCLYYAYGNAIQIWRKEKGVDNNCWKQLITINDVERRGWPLEPVCYMGNKIVMQYEHDDKLLVYDPLDKTFEQVEEKLMGIRSLIPYWDTLYILT